jgi:hypothetical protein
VEGMIEVLIGSMDVCCVMKETWEALVGSVSLMFLMFEMMATKFDE